VIILHFYFVLCQEAAAAKLREERLAAYAAKKAKSKGINGEIV